MIEYNETCTLRTYRMLKVHRVALLTRHVDFTIKAKHALETRDGRYFVTAFTSVQNLLQFFETNEQDIVILDLTVRDVLPDKLITKLRAMQPHIRIVVAPNHPAVLSALAGLQIQGMIDIPMPTRQLLGFMQKLITAPDDLPHVLMPNASDLQRVEETPSEVDTLPQTQPTPEAQALFQRLAAEEPPMPTFEEAATVADVVQNFIKLAEEEKIAVLEASEPDALTTAPSEPASPLAAQILEAALDTSTPVQAVLNRVKETITNIDLEPSDNREPDFLEAIPRTPPKYAASTTVFSSQEAITDGSDLPTERIEPIVKSRPMLEGDFPTLDELRPAPASTSAAEVEPSSTRSALLASKSPSSQDHEVAQLALTLTEMSVETAADAIILVREGEIVAYSGKLPRAEVETLADNFKRTWHEDQATIIDFVRLEATSTDYVLHGVRTKDGFVLYLLFAGSVPISAIRRQSRALTQALEASTSSVPAPAEDYSTTPTAQEDENEDESTTGDIDEAETSEFVPYNFVWLLRDTTNPLTVDHAQQLVKALYTTLRRRTWRIRALDVYSDFVYLRADLPTDQAASRAIREAMRASADLLQPTTPTWAKNLWSDSYLVAPSDRELSLDEIRSFIQFARS
jgi:REP element-mobilizing transposase RayT/DNA-binding NarL/FixJ family response regulator